MPQARLPDINTAFITYRREVLQNLKVQKYSIVFGSLYSLNGLLPEKYRVQISTLEYNKKMSEVEKLMAVCKHCSVQTENKLINPVEVIQPFVTHYLMSQIKHKVWYCTNCKKVNELGETKMIEQVLTKPYFLGIVPDAPTRHEGLMARNTYDKVISEWVWLFINELEKLMGDFRDDNWTKSSEYDESEDYDGSEEAEG